MVFKSISKILLFSGLLFSIPSTVSAVADDYKINHPNSSLNAAEIKVTFYGNGGKLDGHTELIYNSGIQFKDITKPKATRDGQENPDWYYYESGSSTKKICTAETTFYQSVSLYANWKFYNVTFDAGIGKIKEKKNSSTISYSNRTSYDKENCPTAYGPGLVFKCWKLNGEELKFPFHPTEDVTIYADYTYPVGETVTLCLDAGLGRFEGQTSKYRLVQVKKGETWKNTIGTLPEPVYDGTKMYYGWYCDSEPTFGPEYIMNKSLVLKCNYAESIQIIFDANGGKFQDTSSSTKKVSVKLDSQNRHTLKEFIDSAYKENEIPKITIDDKEYDFLGWHNDKETYTDPLPESTEYYVKSQQLTLYASYKVPHKFKFEGFDLEKEIKVDNPDKTFIKSDTNVELNFENYNAGIGYDETNFEISWNNEVKTADKDYTLTRTATGVIVKYTLVILDCPGSDITVRINPKHRIFYANVVPTEGVTKFLLNGEEKESIGLEYNTSFTIACEVEKGYKVTRVDIKEVTKEAKVVASFEGATGSYTMGAMPVSINPIVDTLEYNCTYKKDSHVDTLTCVGGDKQKYKSEVKVTANAVTGYDIDKVTVKYNDVEQVLDEKMTFTMPNTDVLITATTKIHKYTIKFVNPEHKGKQEVLFTDTVEYLSTPTYRGKVPTFDPGDGFVYTFNNTWSPEIVPAVEDKTYVAGYDKKVKTYTISFLNYDGTELYKQENVQHGTMPKYQGDQPTREKDVEYTYVFDKWTPDIVAATADTSYVASYKGTKNKYPVSFYQEDGKTLISTIQVDYGSVPVYKGQLPTKKSSAQYDYVFAGWSPKLEPVTEAGAKYTATFKAVTRVYTVSFYKDKDCREEDLIKSIKVEFGKTPVYDGPTPTKEDGGIHTFTFKSWNKEKFDVVKSDQKYYAIFDSKINTYKLGYNENGGSITKGGSKVIYTDIDAGTNLMQYITDNDIKATHPYAEFEGWSIDYGLNLIDASTTMPGYDCTLTPVWYKYTVTVTGENCKIDCGNFKNVLEIYTDDIGITPNAGYYIKDFQFSYNDGAFKSIQHGMPFKPYLEGIPTNAAKIQLKVICVEKTQKVSVFLDAGAGTFSSEQQTVFEYNKGITYGAIVDKLTIPANPPAGMKFSKWLTADGEELQSGDPINDNVILVAQYTSI